ncbi:putative phosphoesterase [Candidatus Termititenax aidoneus]|uniref:Phosphoesterase n=1 Tax=Termititenax aidoneus TaxID=2218524 RepID=A0A388TB34_TERA1|nr:putative phosphoesterase [Candidatus Termititenax aidoneus]
MFYLKIVAQSRLQVFGDLHGTERWKTLLDTSADKIIFLGDYVDSHGEISEMQIVYNLYDLLALKKNYEDKIVLLWGNHDVAYFLPDVFKYVGLHTSNYRSTLQKLFKSNYEFFQAAYQQKNYLFTHAGLHKRFWQNDLQSEGTDYARMLNYRFLLEPEIFCKASWYRLGAGDYGSIFWADKREFVDEHTNLPRPENWLSGLIQVVGHQPVPEITDCTWQNSTMTWLDTWSNHHSDADAVLELEI